MEEQAAFAIWWKGQGRGPNYGSSLTAPFFGEVAAPGAKLEKLASEFEKRGKTVVKVDRGPFIQAVQKAVTSPDAPWPRDLYDRVEAIR